MNNLPLRYFVAVAELQHMTRAAEHLHITQSTLSHSIQQLELAVKVPLFDRVGRGIRLTQAGELFLGFARRSIREVENGLAAVTELENLVAGRLRIGVIPSINITLLPIAVSLFVKAYPLVRVTVDEMNANNIEAALVQGELYFGVALSPTASPDVVAESLFEERLMLIVRRDSPLARQATIRAKNLKDIHLALLSERYATRKLIDNVFGRHIADSLKLEMNSVNALLQAVRFGHLATILNERALVQEDDLVKILITHPRAVRNAAFVWNKTAYRTPAARRFAEMVADQLRA